MIKIELEYDPKQIFYIRTEVLKTDSQLTEYKIKFGTNEIKSKNMYLKAKEYVPNFFEPLLNLYEKINPKYRGTPVEFNYLVGSYNIHKFLAEATIKKERTFVLNEIKNKKIDSNQFEFFMYSLKKIAEIYSIGNEKKITLNKHYLNIKHGLLNKHFSNSPMYFSCGSTDVGFFGSLKDGKVFTAKVKINGENRRVFIKTPIQHNLGYNPLFIDPKTLDVYAFKTNKFGKIISYTLRIKHDPKNHSREQLLRSAIREYTEKTIENQKKYNAKLIINEKLIHKKKLRRKRLLTKNYLKHRSSNK